MPSQPDDAYLRRVLAEGWSPGGEGKGLLLVDGTVIAWRTLPFGGPHHYTALSLLKIERAKVAAYMLIGPDGATTAYGSPPIPAEQLAKLLARADSRLHVHVLLDEPTSELAEVLRGVV